MKAVQPVGALPTCPPPDPNPTKPRRTLPPLACDAHFHVFGPAGRFPYASDRTFTPYDAPKERLFDLHRLLGFERGIFVHSSCHGSDHSVLVDMLAAGKGRYRGVALLKSDTPKSEIERLHAAGVCGMRFHFFSHLGTPAPLDNMRAVIRAIAPFGWHIAIHVGGQDVLEQYDFITAIGAPVVIDHIGRVDVGEEHAPERVVWGTDWPHPNHTAVPNDGALVDLISILRSMQKRAI